jgi:ribonuclease P protein component
MVTLEPFPKTARLRRRAEFLRVQGTGRKLHTDSFLVFVLPRSESGPTRMGVTVSRKIGGAVRRNRVKRLVREAFRRYRLLFPTGLDLVFIAKKSAVDVDYDQVVQEIERLCRKQLPR